MKGHAYNKLGRVVSSVEVSINQIGDRAHLLIDTGRGRVLRLNVPANDLRQAVATEDALRDAFKAGQSYGEKRLDMMDARPLVDFADWFADTYLKGSS